MALKNRTSGTNPCNCCLVLWWSSLSRLCLVRWCRRSLLSYHGFLFGKKRGGRDLESGWPDIGNVQSNVNADRGTDAAQLSNAWSMALMMIINLVLGFLSWGERDVGSCPSKQSLLVDDAMQNYRRVLFCTCKRERKKRNKKGQL